MYFPSDQAYVLYEENRVAKRYISMSGAQWATIPQYKKQEF